MELENIGTAEKTHSCISKTALISRSKFFCVYEKKLYNFLGKSQKRKFSPPFNKKVENFAQNFSFFFQILHLIRNTDVSTVSIPNFGQYQFLQYSISNFQTAADCKIQLRFKINFKKFSNFDFFVCYGMLF